MKPSLQVITPWICLMAMSMILGCDTIEHVSRGPREYFWRPSYLAYEAVYATFCYDIAKQNEVVWVTASSSSKGGAIWSSDHDDWRVAPYHVDFGGSILDAPSLRTILTLPTGEIFFGGGLSERIQDTNTFSDTGYVIRYQSGVWTGQAIPSHTVLDIAGNAPNNVWASTVHGSVLHFDGSVWSNDTTDVLNRAGPDFETFFDAIEIDQQGQGLLLARLQPRIPTWEKWYFYRRVNGSWNAVDSATAQFPGAAKWGVNLFVSVPGGGVYSSGNAVYKWNGAGWDKMLDTGEEFFAIFGSSDRNLFAATISNSVYHFDGNDWQKLGALELPGVNYVRGIATDTEAYLIGFEGGSATPRPFIVHGHE